MPKRDPEQFARILEFVNRYKQESGISPSVREIAEHMGLHYSSVSRSLAAMKEKGLLDFDGQRNIRTKETKLMYNVVNVPVLGSIACGIPKFAEENIEEYVRLPIALFGKGDFFILRANGDSMVNAKIDDGDLVLIRKQDYAGRGQIVVALIGEDEATLKRYYPEPENRQVRLVAENPAYDDQVYPNIVIQGVAVKVLKDLE